MVTTNPKSTDDAALMFLTAFPSTASPVAGRGYVGCEDVFMPDGYQAKIPVGKAKSVS